MRVFWSVILAGGLLLAGFDVFDSRQADRQAARQAAQQQGPAVAEDGTGFPPQ
jgi:hypothetical protein